MSTSKIDQEERLTKIFHKGCTIHKSLIKYHGDNSGFFGNYVEEVLRQQGYKVSPNGVDLPDLGIEVKTRERKGTSPLTLGRLNENEFKTCDTYYATGLYNMCKKQLRITWEYDTDVIRICDSVIYDFTVYTIQEDFNRHFLIAQQKLRENQFSKDISYVGVGNGFCFERHLNTSTWQYRASDAALKRLCKRTSSDRILENFVAFQ